jgi:hypothetical protein
MLLLQTLYSIAVVFLQLCNQRLAVALQFGYSSLAIGYSLQSRLFFIFQLRLQL